MTDTIKLKTLFIRLSTGEDIITQCSMDETTFTVYYPFKIVYTVSPAHNGALTISLLEWVFPNITEQQEFTLKKEEILTTAAPSEILHKYYNKVVDKLKNNERYSVVYPGHTERKTTSSDAENITEEELELIEKMIKDALKPKEEESEPDETKPIRKKRIN